MDKWLQIPEKQSCSKEAKESTSVLKCTTSEEIPSKVRKVVRKYDPNYINIGFTVTEVDSEPRPQCVICFEILSNQCMKPSLLKRHLSTKHSSLENKPREYFISKCNEMKIPKKIMSNFISTNQKGVEASFLVSLRIAQCGKAHTIGEELLLPAAKDMVNCILGEHAAKQLDVISLSNDTVRRRIDVMALNVKNMLIERIKSSDFFAIQLDESTDVTNYAQLMVYVRYLYKSEIKEDFLFCTALSTHTTADEIFKNLNHFFEENGLLWKKCVGFCSDGARAMTGKYGGVVSKIKAITENCVFTHCAIHREALVVKRIPDEFKNVLQESIKIVNYIKSRALNSRLFSKLCSEMASDHIQLLLHTEVRWLSRGKMLNRFFELHSEVRMFLMETNFDLRDRLTDELWLLTIAYLSDIFSRLNTLNLSLQGKTINRFIVNDKIYAFVKKCEMIINTVSKENLQSFPNLENFVNEHNINIQDNFISNIKRHCQMLVDSFQEYFKEDYCPFLWIRNPFVHNELPNNLPVDENESLIELSCDGDLHAKFTQLELSEFWLIVKSEYPSLSKKALTFLIPFTTTYLCETGFSSMVIIKNKLRNKLNLEPNLRLKLSTLQPDISSLVSNMQHHPSH